MRTSLGERLRKAGIRHYGDLIHDQPKGWLVKNFKAEGAAPKYSVNIARPMRNLGYQMNKLYSKQGIFQLNQILRTFPVPARALVLRGTMNILIIASLLAGLPLPGCLAAEPIYPSLGDAVRVLPTGSYQVTVLGVVSSMTLINETAPSLVFQPAGVNQGYGDVPGHTEFSPAAGQALWQAVRQARGPVPVLAAGQATVQQSTGPPQGSGPGPQNYTGPMCDFRINRAEILTPAQAAARARQIVKDEEMRDGYIRRFTPFDLGCRRLLMGLELHTSKVSVFGSMLGKETPGCRDKAPRVTILDGRRHVTVRLAASQRNWAPDAAGWDYELAPPLTAGKRVLVEVTFPKQKYKARMLAR